MFFYGEELEVAEELAWKMLDEWNHAYMPNLMNYAHFYYKDQIIFDPWMNEKSQGLLWPDHESKETSVNPVEYYGRITIENYIVNLFMLRPEWAPEITEKIKRNLGDDGRLERITFTMPIVVYIAMSEEQAEEEKGAVCIEWEIPDSSRIYFEMVKLPSELVTIVENGWKREIFFRKKNAKKIFELLYPDGIRFDYKKALNRINGEKVRLIGFGD